jgi:uncharacterized protein (DUF362 family)/NAD-dependent dihydropyrimidine dehydrogenase PreA subunit
VSAARPEKTAPLGTTAPLVTTARCAGYGDDDVTEALRLVLEPLGGIGAFVKPGDRVYLKVNLLVKATPDRAITTHPALVRALVRAVRAAGASDVAVGDSPGGRTTTAAARAIFEASGMATVCAEEGARVSLLDDAVVRVPVEGKLYTAFNLGREAVEADVLISMPKLKTHGFMAMTGGVKNLFGCIPGIEKAQFHAKVPDRADFAEMLIDLMLACRPELTVMDAVVAMEGEGPSSGTPRHVGAVLASADPAALDVVAAAVAGFEPMDVYTVAAAARRGLAPSDADAVDVQGVPWRELTVRDFAHPARDVSSRMPPAVGRWMRRRFTSRPELSSPEACTRCRTCERACPVAAITMTETGPAFDHDTCIRCYCCQELCPENAIGLRTPWVLAALLAGRPRSKA